ncbi:MAG: radical SAM protein [Verrucomicrobiia bacterium]
MRILLVLPAADHVRVTRNHPDVPKRAMLRFSVLPLTTVAALTRPEHSVRIIDENVEPLDLDAECDLVGVSFMTALAPRAYEIAGVFRKRGKLVIGGGYHPTLCPDDAKAHFDALVIGDAEGSWERVLADAQQGTLRGIYRQTPPCAAAPALPGGELRVRTPRRDLLAGTARHYATINAVQAGRGCRHACRYCSVTVFHQRTYRHRPVAEVISELRALKGDFIFVDDNIIADRDYAMELFEAMIPLRKRWVSQCSVLIADDPELLNRAHAAGCRGLFIGIETASQANLAALGKQFNHPQEYTERLARIRRAGIGVIAGMIVGLDADDRTVFEETLRFLDQNQVDALQLNILTPLPGTPLHDEYKAAGRVTDSDWSHYDYRHVVFKPARMTAAELQGGADWLLAQFYRIDRILWRFSRAVFAVGLMPAVLGLKLGLTYRYDVLRGRIRGWNPARSHPPESSVTAGQKPFPGKVALFPV